MFMDTTKKATALFDCDGVIIDTEGQYTVFWNEMGEKYVNDENFSSKVKGQTLVQIYDKYFAGEPEKQRDITDPVPLLSDWQLQIHAKLLLIRQTM